MLWWNPTGGAGEDDSGGAERGVRNWPATSGVVTQVWRLQQALRLLRDQAQQGFVKPSLQKWINKQSRVAAEHHLKEGWDVDVVQEDLNVLVCESQRTTVEFNCSRPHSLLWPADLWEFSAWVNELITELLLPSVCCDLTGDHSWSTPRLSLEACWSQVPVGPHCSVCLTKVLIGGKGNYEMKQFCPSPAPSPYQSYCCLLINIQVICSFNCESFSCCTSLENDAQNIWLPRWTTKYLLLQSNYPVVPWLQGAVVCREPAIAGQCWVWRWWVFFPALIPAHGPSISWWCGPQVLVSFHNTPASCWA